MTRPRQGVACLALGLGLLVGLAPAQFGTNYRGAPIHYGEHATDDPVARLGRRLEAGEAELEHDQKFGYLAALLSTFDVPRTSQGLVFSKTSFQHRLISPASPRAVYFGDEVYVGYVPGGEVLEITAMDPVQGPIFYTLDQRERATPLLRRRGGECLTCHGGRRTADWPGNLVRSVYSDARGQPLQTVGSFETTHDSPLARRWGGWYVTGTHGAQRHMGNVTLSESASPEELDVEAGANVTDLSGRVATHRYLTPHSDIVALMVLEHQTHMHNLLARASYRARRALYRQAGKNRALGKGPDHVDAATRRELRSAAGELLDYLLFRKEAPLEAQIRGTSTFAADFVERGRQDDEGRSLRDLDLKTRLFRYPCSYVIYSPSFDSLPAPILDIVYKRLWRILTGEFGRGSWGISRDQRQAILDILLVTKNGLPEDWQPVVVR